MTSTPPTATSTTIPEPAPSDRLSAEPTTARIRVGLPGATVILDLEGRLVGHLDPPLPAPETSEERHARLASQVSDLPDGCVADAGGREDGWIVLCEGTNPTVEGLADEDRYQILGADQVADLPAGGRWTQVFERAVVAQYVASDGTPYAVVHYGELLGRGPWNRSPACPSVVYDYLPDDRLLAWMGPPGCTSGLYAVNQEQAESQLLWSIDEPPVWAEVVAGLETGAVAGLDWLQSSFREVRDSDGTTIHRVDMAPYGSKALAWDGDDGFVYVDPGSRLRWVTPEEDVEVPTEPGSGIASVYDVVRVDDSVLAGVVMEAWTLEWIDLETGAVSDPPPDRLDFSSEDGVAIFGQGRWAWIDSPDWASVTRGEGGEPIPPYPLPEVVVTDESGVELLRYPVGDSDTPFAMLHDFDGRRVVYSVEPHEPALPLRTVYIVDIECETGCHQVLSTGPFVLDLVGTLESKGTVVKPDLTGAIARAGGEAIPDVYPIDVIDETDLARRLRQTSSQSPTRMAWESIQRGWSGANTFELVDVKDVGDGFMLIYTFRSGSVIIEEVVRIIGHNPTGPIYGLTKQTTYSNDRNFSLQIDVEDAGGTWTVRVAVTGADGPTAIGVRYGDFVSTLDGDEVEFTLPGPPEPWGTVHIAPAEGGLDGGPFHVVAIPPGAYSGPGLD